MTIHEAIDNLDEMKPNMMSNRLKIAALGRLDGLIMSEIISKHEGAEDYPAFTGYTEETDPGTVLLAPWPYDEMYTYWLMAEVDRQTMETDKYNNDMVTFNQKYEMFHDYWRRNHMPLTNVRELRI